MMRESNVGRELSTTTSRTRPSPSTPHRRSASVRWPSSSWAGSILGGALLVEFKLNPPVWVHVLLWGILTPVLAFFLLRVLKATLIALQFKHKAEQGRFALD